MFGFDLTLTGIAIAISLIISLTAKYLTVNKLWIRKHLQNVADSISVSAVMIDLLLFAPILIFNLYEQDYGNLGKNLITLVVTIILILIGISFWVPSDLTIIEKIKRALNMDHKEYKNMIKDIMHIGSLNKVFEILCSLALVDNDLAKKEEELLRQFAKDYKLDFDEYINKAKQAMAQQDNNISYFHIKQLIEEYLNSSPHNSIVIMLKDLVQQLIKADDEITKEEEIISAEIIASLDNYISGPDKVVEKYNVLVIPQNKDEEQAILALNKDLKLSDSTRFSNVQAYIIDSFSSAKLANIARHQYIEILNCFVTIEKF